LNGPNPNALAALASPAAIASGTPAALSRLRELTAQGNLWPMGLFLYLDVADAIGLFERLSATDVTGNFLALVLL
jgi:hypothetical protein